MDRYLPTWMSARAASKYILLWAILMLWYPSRGQKTMALEEAISLAQSQSIYYHQAKNFHEKSYWRFHNFRASLKPQIRLSATIPTFFRSINPITQPDGTIQFVRISQANNEAGISVSQQVGPTGGAFTVGTNLRRTDNFTNNQSSYFLSTPFQISYTQGSLLFNALAWKSKIEPLLFEIAERGYSEDLELAAMQASIAFFDALSAQISLDMSRANRANTESFLGLAQERFKLGTIGQSDLLQLELNALKAQNQLSQDTMEWERAQGHLKKLLRLLMATPLLLEIPTISKIPPISYEKALEEARSNRRAVLAFRSRRLEAEAALAEAKGKNNLSLGVYANLGTQQTGPQLVDAYRALQNQQSIGFTVDVPLLDWGYRKSQIRLAKANLELTETNNIQDELDFEHEIYLQVLHFNHQGVRVTTAQKIDTIAQMHYRITQERYLLGKQSVSDVNGAMEENLMARQGYIQAIKDYWVSYYMLRRLTLYDFILDNKLNYWHK